MSDTPRDPEVSWWVDRERGITFAHIGPSRFAAWHLHRMGARGVLWWAIRARIEYAWYVVHEIIFEHRYWRQEHCPDWWPWRIARR